MTGLGEYDWGALATESLQEIGIASGIPDHVIAGADQCLMKQAGKMTSSCNTWDKKSF